MSRTLSMIMASMDYKVLNFSRNEPLAYGNKHGVAVDEEKFSTEYLGDTWIIRRAWIMSKK